MKPGLTRAVPAAILGFIGACVFVIVMRALQSIDPVWDPEIGLILAVFVTSGAFIWGMGATDPRMNTHPHEPEVDEETGLAIVSAEAEDHHHEEEGEEEPDSVLGYSLWSLSFWLTVILVAIGAFVTLPTGLVLQQTSDPAASPTGVGYSTWEIPVLGVETELSQLTLFAGFILVTIVTLLVIGGGLALLFTSLNEGVKSVAEVDSTRMLSSTPEEDIEVVEVKYQLSDYALFAGLALVLFLMLYYVFVGVPVSEPEWQRVALSAFFGIVFAAYFTIRPILHSIIGEGLTNFFIFLGAAGGLYTAFYYVLIGLAIPSPEWLRWSLSVINALAFAFILVYPQVLSHTIGRGAGSLAKSLRGLPEGLGNK